ncbi:MAG: glutathione S-transferase family protein [Rickettsiales bacterium]|nr:glutathione S-transferase family protein [Rickettsiales bacterium]
MGLLEDGKWVDQWYDTKSTGGKFVRQDSAFRHHIGQSEFPVEKNRYHLYISHACPWAHRTAIFRKLKNLESYITLSVVDAVMLENGWELSEGQDDVNNKEFLHQIYCMANPTYTGRVTVPVLWDKETKTIINNESSEIIRMFNSAFNQETGNTLDFYPEALRKQIDEMNDFVYHSINNGVYKAGFSTNQDVYHEEVQKLFSALDSLEERLSSSRYLIGDQITEADWRLFTTLLRFDPVYVGHFKCNIRRIEDYPNLSNYLRELYQIDGIADTVHMDHIKDHYYKSHLTINPTQIVPDGPEFDYMQPHNRATLSQDNAA